MTHADHAPRRNADEEGELDLLVPTANAPSSPHRGLLQVSDDFAVLDDPVEQADFTQYKEGSQGRIAESVLVVQGMYCAACADAIEGVLCDMPGVIKADVHAATRRLTLEWDPTKVQVSALASAVGKSGYRLLPMREALSLDNRLKESRRILWRLFVSGLCMMQVMMYVWPAYITEPGEIPPDMEQLLRWASWVLSLPVLLFVSGSFFAGAWRDMRQGRVGMDTPISIGILVTFLASTAATFDPSGPWGHEVWFDSLTMFIFFLMGGRYLEFKLRDRTAGALDELMNRLPEVCERQRTYGGFELVSARRLVAGDVVRVQAGQAFPADGRLLSERASVDEALLTGESHPLTKVQGDSVIAGSFNLAGPAVMSIEKVGGETRFAQIVSLMEKASTDKPRLAILADKIAGPFLVAVLLAAMAAGVYWWQADASRALAVAVSVLIVTCPCALSLATPAAMLASAGTLAKRGTLVRRLQAFEVLAKVDTVVFDKTGTLTQDKVVLADMVVRQGIAPAQALGWAGALAAASLHPASRALARAAQADREPGAAQIMQNTHLEQVEEISGFGLRCVHPLLGEWRLGSARHCGVDAQASHLRQGREDSPRVYLADASGWVATFLLDEGIRDDAQAAVNALQALGIQTWLLSGDRIEAAQRVAQAVGVNHVVGSATPERKLAEVAALQAQGRTVAMVGDGLNDGPVLALANTSFAMGTAAPLAQAQSDYVIQSGRVSEVLATLIQARQTMRIVKQNLWWAAGYNAVSVPLALVGWMPPWLAGLGMATSSFWVIANAMRLSKTGSQFQV